MNETVPHHEIQLLCIWHPSHDACRDEQCSSPHGPDGVLLKMIEQTLQVRCVNPPRYDQHRTYDNRGNMWETLTAADSEKRWHWWWLIRLLVYWRSAAPVWEEQSPASLKCDCRTEYQKITRIWRRAFRRDLTWMLPSFYCFHDDRGRSQLWGHWCPDLLAVLLLLIDSFIWLESFYMDFSESTPCTDKSWK